MQLPDIDTPSSAYSCMLPKWKQVNALLGGTHGMREAGELYLPKHTNETDVQYKDRLQRTVLLNMFSKSLTSLAAKPFSQPVKVGEKLPEPLKPLVEDMDLLGHDITAFGKEVFKDGLAKGFSHMLVEFPTVDPEVVKTKADEDAAGVRPYVVHIKAESLIAAYAEIRDGKEFLLHVRVLETEMVRASTGFGEERLDRVRVYEPGTWEVWERRGTQKFQRTSHGTTSLDFIPLVTWYAGSRVDLMKAEPPLQDLADKNIEHWQSSSDQRNVLTVARFPILASSGNINTEGLILGPRKLLSCKEPDGKIYYVEHTGHAISAGRQDMEDLKTEMSMLGVELLVRQSGSSTATEKSINSAQANSELQCLAESFSDALEMVLFYASKWKSEGSDEQADDAIEVTVHNDFGITEAEGKDLDILFKTRGTGDISRIAWLEELKRRGTLRPEYDAEADAEIIESEGPSLADMKAEAEIEAMKQPAAGAPPKPGEKAPAGDKKPPVTPKNAP